MTNREIKIAYQEFSSHDQLEEKDKELVLAAIEAPKNSYAPYSRFNVGAAVRLEEGEIICGANQENAAYPSGTGAERTALFYASASRPDTSMTAIAIAATQEGKLCQKPVTPCGACRQVMSQYQLKSGTPMSILLVGADIVWKFERVDDLLPLMFDSI